MTRTLNKVLLVGNVGKEPDFKYTSSGIPVVTFRMATTEVWRDKENNMQEHTDWHTVTAWRGLAEVIQKIVKKGSKVFVEGKLQSRQFDDKSGQRKQVVEVLAENILLLEYKKFAREEVEITDEFSLNGHKKYNSPFEDTITNPDSFTKIDDMPF
ncbi:MAG: single-stranded DNA-binding protein [Ignavibacteriae bacterium]|nr:single-stranded DNA-binding protein [Ignavibacteriota bacterium]